MRTIRLFALIAAAGCGDNAGGPPVGPGHDAGPDSPPIDMPIDEPTTTAPVNLTNLTAVAGVTKRADFNTPLFFKPDSSAVAVVANFNAAAAPTRDDAYVVPLDGTAFTRLTDASTCGTGAQCDVGLLAWTADGTSLFMEGDMATNNQFEVFKLDPATADQTTPTLALDVAATTTSTFNLFAVDAGGGATRVWAVGDFRTNGSTEAGGFASDATFPFSVATPPTILVPGGNTAELFDGTGSTDNVFDARGTKIAFISNTTLITQFDLIVADADGANPIVVIPGAVTGTISAVALSPDGTKVAFLRDSITAAGGFDLFVAPVAANATAVQVSPPRAGGAATLAVFFQVEWSSDSKFLAFSGDLTTDTVSEAFVVDTTAGSPTAQTLLAAAEVLSTTGTKGVRGKLLFDADNNIYFRARIGDAAEFTFFKAATDGTKTTFDLPKRADQSTPDIGAFGISPDHHTLVFSSDAPVPGTYDLYKVSL